MIGNRGTGNAFEWKQTLRHRTRPIALTRKLDETPAGCWLWNCQISEFEYQQRHHRNPHTAACREWCAIYYVITASNEQRPYLWRRPPKSSSSTRQRIADARNVCTVRCYFELPETPQQRLSESASEKGKSRSERSVTSIPSAATLRTHNQRQ